jgi:arylsulfatase
MEKFGKKPNIVYILADDIGYTELGSYGGGIRGFKTSNLDRMADQGMRFLSYYSPGLYVYAHIFDDRTYPSPYWY